MAPVSDLLSNSPILSGNFFHPQLGQIIQPYALQEQGFFIVSSSRSIRLCDRLTGQPAAAPTGLEIKASSDPIHIQ